MCYVEGVDPLFSYFSVFVTDVPVHRYRLSWREIPTFPFHQGEILKEQVRLSGSRLNYTIKRLKKDKNYHVDIQAICLWKKKRLKSPKAALNVSTHNIKGWTLHLTADTSMIDLRQWLKLNVAFFFFLQTLHRFQARKNRI